MIRYDFFYCIYIEAGVRAEVRKDQVFDFRSLFYEPGFSGGPEPELFSLNDRGGQIFSCKLFMDDLTAS